MQLDAMPKVGRAFQMKGYHSPSGIILGENHSLWVQWQGSWHFQIFVVVFCRGSFDGSFAADATGIAMHLDN